MGLSRSQLWQALEDAAPIIPGLLNDAYENELYWEWAEGDRSPHGMPWHSCLSGDTEVVTRDGIRKIKDLVGIASLLIPNGGSGTFRDVDVRSYGVAPLRRITLRKSKQIKRVYATGNHRWYKTKKRPHEDRTRDTVVVTTDGMMCGDILKSISARSIAFGKNALVRFASAQGFVFGDGSRRDSERSIHVDMFGEKARDMGVFFAGHETESVHLDRQVSATRVLHLPSLWKDLPTMRENRSFLLSWVAGYFAADGCVGTQGQAIISSAFKENIDFVRGVLAVCGIGYGGISETISSGRYPSGGEYRDRSMYNMQIKVVDLPDWFFLREKHRVRIEARVSRRETWERFWKVESVEQTDLVEEVFCASVPGAHAFSLADGVVSGNSFHASAFPGDDPVACGRKAVYELLDPPAEKPLQPRIKAMFDQGLDLEHNWVRRLNAYGSLLSADVTADDDFQTGFEDSEHWLTGSCDAIILPRGWMKPYIGEFKTTSDEKVRAMLAETPSYPASHGKYLRQIKTYIGMAHELPYTPTVNLCDDSGAIISLGNDGICPVHRKRCAFTSTTLLPPDSGELVYSSREEPLLTASFKVHYDSSFMEQGRAKLAEWRDYFLRGEIPPHPREAKHLRVGRGGMGWSIHPCTWCELKKSVCRPDHAAGATRLEESALIEFAKSIRPDWSYEQKRAATLFRWQSEPVEEESVAVVT